MRLDFDAVGESVVDPRMRQSLSSHIGFIMQAFGISSVSVGSGESSLPGMPGQASASFFGSAPKWIRRAGSSAVNGIANLMHVSGFSSIRLEDYSEGEMSALSSAWSEFDRAMDMAGRKADPVSREVPPPPLGLAYEEGAGQR